MPGMARRHEASRDERLRVGTTLRRLDLGRRLEAPRLDFHLADAELLHLAGDRHREGINNAEVLRDLEMGDFAAAEVADFLFSGRFSRFQPDPRENRFA